MSQHSLMVILALTGAAILEPGALLGDINYPSRLEINMGPMTFAVQNGGSWTTWYDNSHYPTQQGIYGNCGNGTQGNVPVRTCFQQILAKYKAQNISGINFRYQFDDALDANNNVIQAWVTGLTSFLADVYTYGPTAHNVTIGSGFNGGSVIHGGSQTSCHGTQIPYFGYRRTSPYGEGCDSSYTACLPADQSYPDAWSCSKTNPSFVGWSRILGAGGILDTVLQAAQSNHLIVEELELQSEINVGSFTVQARLIVDPSHSNYDVLGVARQLMSNHGYDPGRVTYGAGMDRCPNTSGCGQCNCGSVYGDSARLLNMDQTIAAMSGGMFGLVENFAQCGTNHNCRLVCSGNLKAPIAQLPISHPTPTIIDVHPYSCLTMSNGNCDQSSMSSIQNEAQTDFNALATFQASYWPPSGWRYVSYGYDPNMANALVMIGETHGHTIPRNDQNPNDWCHDDYGNVWNPLVTDSMVAGFNSSNLRNRTLPNSQPGWVVFRPWEDLAWPYGPPQYNSALCNPVAVNPPYKPSN